MEIKCSYIFLIPLIICKLHIYTNSEVIDEFLESLRNKIRHLEEDNQIVRDYEPYIQREFQNEEEYDFIIVGTGSSGSAIIHRLAEVSEWKILALEAGGEPDILADIPSWSPMLEATDLNWRFLTEKEENLGLALDDQRMHWPKGKALGGSSILNYMIFSRGAKEDYNKWANLGNPGWSYKDVLPFFKKMETCKLQKHDKEFRGYSGPIYVEDTYRSKAGEVLMEAAKYAGYQYIDYNGAGNHGVSYIQGTTRKGLRCSGEKCYIRPVKNNKNLTIRLHSRVTKVIIEDNIARGVEYVRSNKTYKAYAKKEVILSAGVINSPHILLLSGIGPKKALEKFGIEPIIDLPVGKKVIDHPAYFGLAFTLNESIGFNAELALQDEAFKELYNKGSGILHDLGGADSLLFTKTPYATNEATDIELILYAAHFIHNPDINYARTMRLSKDFYQKMYKEYEGQNAITCVVILQHPLSFGHLELRSADPFDHPKIYSGYYTDPEGKDIKTLIAGIKEAIRIFLTPPFEKYGIKVMDKPMVGCENFIYDSDDYWECAIRYMTNSVYHHTTTCKMGPTNDSEAVVDSRLKVHGMKKLRIADTSVIPIALTGHTNAPAFLVGEKAADMIKEEYLA